MGPATRSRRVQWWALGLGLLGLYLFSAYPTVSPYRDSGDLATAAYDLGVAHPPGYPLYVLLGHAWLDAVPFGNPAYRLHLLSAVCGVLACLWVARAAAHGAMRAPRTPASEKTPAAAVAPGSGVAAFLLLGFAPAFWHLSITSEMYSLNALFAAALLAWAVGAGPHRSDSASPPDLSGSSSRNDWGGLWASALVGGLGLANHQTLILAAPALLWIWLPAAGESGAGSSPDGVRSGGEGETAETAEAARRWAAAAAWGLVGMLAYLYLPLRSRADPVVNWGEPGTPEMFWRLVTRADLGAIRLHPDRPAGFVSWSQWLAGLRIAGRMVVDQTGWTGAALAAWGAAVHRKSRAAQGAFLALLVSGPIFIGWANLDPGSPETMPILEPHLVLPLVYAAFLAGLGAADLRRSIRDRTASAATKATLAAACAVLGIAGWILPSSAAALAGGRSLRKAWEALAGYRSDFSAWDYGRALLDSLPPGAVVVDPDDVTAFSLSYLQTVRGERRDLRPVLFFRTRWGYRQLRRRHPELLPDWEPRSGQELYGAVIEKNLKARVPIYVDLPQKTPAGAVALASGLAYRLAPADALRNSRAGLQRAMDGAAALQRLLRFRPAPPDSDFFSMHTAAYSADALNNLGIEAQRLGRARQAVDLYRRALVLKPDVTEAWINLGNAQLALDDVAAAEGDYRIAGDLKPSPPVTYNLGRVYLLEGRYADATREFERAIREGDLPEARNDLGLVFYRTGRTKEAVEVWEDLLTRAPAYVTPLYNLGMAYRDLKDYRRARLAFTLYRDHAPDAQARAAVQKELDALGPRR